MSAAISSDVLIIFHASYYILGDVCLCKSIWSSIWWDGTGWQDVRCGYRRHWWVKWSSSSIIIIIIIIIHHHIMISMPFHQHVLLYRSMSCLHLSTHRLIHWPISPSPSIHPIIRVILRMRSCESGELCSQQAVAAAPGTWPGNSSWPQHLSVSAGQEPSDHQRQRR